MVTNIWTFITEIFNFILNLINKFWELWNWEFKLLGDTYQFKELLTVSLLVIVGLLLVKKLVPAA